MTEAYLGTHHSPAAQAERSRRRAHKADRRQIHTVEVSEKPCPGRRGACPKYPPRPQQGRLASWCRGSAHARDRVARAVQTLVVWWNIRGGVHVTTHSHPNEQIVSMLKGKMRTAGFRPPRVDITA